MAKAKRTKSVSALFIGNSFTQRNNLPGLLAAMARQQGISFEHELISAGGASLRTHWNAGRALAAIRTGDWDYVVLQEQSTLPVKNAGRMAENIRLFDEAIKQAGSKTVLYMTWARQHSPEHQPLISEAYTSIGKAIGATVAPVGLAWKTFGSKYDIAALYDSDQSHPSLAGSYLAACVFLTVLFQVNPLGLEALPDTLDPGLVTKIQRSAWKQCGTAH